MNSEEFRNFIETATLCADDEECKTLNNLIELFDKQEKLNKKDASNSVECIKNTNLHVNGIASINSLLDVIKTVDDLITIHTTEQKLIIVKAVVEKFDINLKPAKDIADFCFKYCNKEQQ